MRRVIANALLVATLGLACAHGEEVVVRVHPPREVIEKRVVAPGPGYVWIGGYHRWDGNAYIWVPGRWDRPPHEHAVWVRHRWVHRNGGWVLVEGHWR
jgi:hypothetical protein